MCIRDRVHNSKKNKIADTLFDVIKKYVSESKYEDLKTDIVQCLQGEVQSLDVGVIEKQCGVLERLNRSKIIISEDKVKWQDSIYMTGRCLVQIGSIEEEYLNSIISQIMYYGCLLYTSAIAYSFSSL